MIRLLKFFGYSIVAIVCGLMLVLSGAYLYLSPGLPSVEALRSIQLQIPLRVYSSDEKLIAEFGEMRRTPIRFADIPPNFINALLSAEDDNFANHYGVDPSSLVRAATQLVKSGHIQSGGSTITMQLARNVFLSSERTYTRKIREILLAIQIEDELSKEEILELYLKQIFLGERAYGVAGAAQTSFSRPLGALTPRPRAPQAASDSPPLSASRGRPSPAAPTASPTSPSSRSSASPSSTTARRRAGSASPSSSVAAGSHATASRASSSCPGYSVSCTPIHRR